MVKIVAAAIIQDGKLYTLPSPARHHDLISLIYGEIGRRVDGRQGFVTEDGTFVDREEARRIVVKNGQCPTPCHCRELFSEDLW